MSLSQLPRPPAARRVLIDAVVARIPVLVDAVMAPAEPAVGIHEPYPIQLDVVRVDGGAFFPVSEPERAVLVRALQQRYYALEVPNGS